MTDENKKIFVVTEGKFDAELLKKLLPENKLKNNFEILPADGFSSALSKVKSILSQNKGSVVFLLDTDSTDKEKIEEKKDFVDEYVSSRYYKDFLKTVWAEPELEIIFFDKKNLLEDQLHRPIAEETWELAKISPRTSLERIFKLDRKQLLNLVDNNSNIRNNLKENKIIREILEFAEHT